MREEFCTLLTGEPLEWQLTNEQRPCFGIAPVGEDWACIQLPRSKYDDYDTYMYLDGSLVRYVVIHGESVHQEYAVDETLSADGMFILPKRSTKPIKLTAATLTKRKPIGMRLLWERKYGYCGLGNDSSGQGFYSSLRAGDKLNTFADFQRWVEEWCAETTDADLREIAAFAARRMQTVKHREGDVFCFRWNRRLWGYGRILLDYDRMRREKIPFFDCLMAKPLAVQIFQIVTEDRKLPVDVVLAAKALPSMNMMDDALHYGEYEIIGNAPLPQNRDALCPIMYGVGYSRERLLRFQQGRVYRELPGMEPVSERGYMNSAVGRHPRVTLPLMQACLQEGDVAYWASEVHYNRDLRNPAYADDFAAVRRQVGVEWGI